MKSLSRKSGRAGRVGFLVGVFFGWLTAKKLAVTQSNLRKLDFSTSSQKMGLRFSERLRDVFRFRWLGRG